MKLASLAVLLVLVSCSSPPSGPPSSAAPPTGSPDSPQSLEDVERQMIALLEKFDRLDYNGDGFLTRKEILDGIRNEGVEELAPHELDRAFAFYDTNRDGRISLHEANAGFRRGPQGLAG